MALFPLNQQRLWVSSALLFLLAIPLSLSTSLSDTIFDSHAHTTRTLLQARQGCSVNFEFMNYTVITSKCKGPQYPPKECCAAFKEFACPYASELNDLQNDCASTMFSYINLYGKYPPGLFSSECREGKEGLACELQPSASADDTGDQAMHCPSLLLMITACFFLILFL